MSEVKTVLVGVMHTMAYEGKPNVDVIKQDAKLNKVTAADRDAAWEQYQEELKQQEQQNAGTDADGATEQNTGDDSGDANAGQEGGTETGAANDGDSSDESGTGSDADNQNTPPSPDENKTGSGEAEAVLVVKTKRAKGSRRRAGFRFGGEPVAIPLADLSDEQLDEIKADPALSVKEELV
ncbi:hypothetical protein Q7C_837 [Methylophaga frappieri]|uniref:Uncharacterized protein n=1 Tax=Methylophaga frappieri (strain ATCC BAA-2434 / DSM 25690 / JAM7) TaxID=754477 RepID=I1YGG3_METFJ|nr:HI1506-related protein [Methylophaga frappieri]AFJ02006.1 hypothetical protein Q7C_837 [Methylophaga frappieri]